MGKTKNETAERREARLKYCRDWHASHRDEENRRRMERYRGYQKSIQITEHQIRRLEVLERMGGKCRFCEETDEAILIIDHVMDDGAAERKNFRNVYHRLQKMDSIPFERYQILCGHCNHKKRMFGPDPSKWPPKKTVAEQLALLQDQRSNQNACTSKDQRCESSEESLP